jgi:hypothetical protein
MITIGQQYQERGARRRIFTVTALEGGGYTAVCSFNAGPPVQGKSPKRGSGARVARVSVETLRKRFVRVTP